MQPTNTKRTSAYWPKLKQQIHFLNERTFFIWFCGILFTRLATGIWVGDWPSFVGITLLSLVFLFMHIGYYLTMAVRVPIILASCYLGQVHLIEPGDFFLQKPIELSFAHFFLLWLGIHFSFLFRAELYPFCLNVLHLSDARAPQAVNAEDNTSPNHAKVISLSSRAGKLR